MKYLKVWTSFRDVIVPLSDAEKGRLFDAMLLYTETGEEPDGFSGNEAILWPAAKQNIDLTAERNERLRQNGAIGGKAKASKTKQDVANYSNTYQDEAKVSCKEKKRNEKERNEKENSPTGRGHFVPPTLEEVTAFCQERGNGINPQHFIDYYAARGWELKPGQKVKDWKACVRTWESREKAVPVQKPIQSPAAAEYKQRDLAGTNTDATRRMLEWLDGGDI